MATREKCITILNSFDERFLDSVETTLLSLKTVCERAFEISKEAEHADIMAKGRVAIRQLQEESVRNGTSEMTLDEINAIITESRRERGLYDKVSA